MKELAFCWDGGWLVGVDGGIEWSSSDGLMLVRLAVLHKKKYYSVSRRLLFLYIGTPAKVFSG